MTDTVNRTSYRLTDQQLARVEALELARDACSSASTSECHGHVTTVTELTADAHHLILVAQWILGEDEEGGAEDGSPADPGAIADMPLFSTRVGLDVESLEHRAGRAA